LPLVMFLWHRVTPRRGFLYYSLLWGKGNRLFGGEMNAKRHILSMEGMPRDDIDVLLNKAERFLEDWKGGAMPSKPLAGRRVTNLFFENSTRTRTSFELAGKHLGATVINMSVSASSIKKGETLLDTAATLNAMGTDILVVRHPCSGAVELLSRQMCCCVINAGDGMHEHPTQGLVDALAIRRRKGKIEGLKIVICGDVKHSRVARSNIHVLSALHGSVHIMAPPTLVPFGIEDLGVCVHGQIGDALRDADVIMMLRVQRERVQGSFVPSVREYYHFFGIDKEKMKGASPDAVLMHPGPVNRGVEIDSALADDIDRSLIAQQVEVGVAVRMACLQWVLE